MYTLLVIVRLGQSGNVLDDDLFPGLNLKQLEDEADKLGRFLDTVLASDIGQLVRLLDDARLYFVSKRERERRVISVSSVVARGKDINFECKGKRSEALPVKPKQCSFQ